MAEVLAEIAAYPTTTAVGKVVGLAPLINAELPPSFRGNGYLGGTFPDGVTAVDGVPTRATVRILYRPKAGGLGDGMIAAQTESAEDGTWRVDGLNPDLTYDVVGRKDGHNDVIMAGVRPVVE